MKILKDRLPIVIILLVIAFIVFGLIPYSRLDVNEYSIKQWVENDYLKTEVRYSKCFICFSERVLFNMESIKDKDKKEQALLLDSERKAGLDAINAFKNMKGIMGGKRYETVK